MDGDIFSSPKEGDWKSKDHDCSSITGLDFASFPLKHVEVRSLITSSSHTSTGNPYHSTPQIFPEHLESARLFQTPRIKGEQNR